jgi:hypothetical protein
MEILSGIIVDNCKGKYDGRVSVSIKQEDGGLNDDGTIATVIGSTAFALSGNVGVSSVPRNGTQVYMLKDDTGAYYIIGTIPGPYNTTAQYPAQTKNADNTAGTPFTPQVHSEMTGDADAYKNTQIIRTQSGHMIRFCDVESRKELDIVHSSGSYIKFMDDGSIKIYAKKNLEIDVDNDMITYVMGNQYTEIRKDKSQVIKKNEELTVEQNRDKHVKHQESIDVGGSYSLAVMNTILQRSGGETTLEESKLTVQTENSEFSGAVTVHGNIVSHADVQSKGGGLSLNNHIHDGDSGGTTSAPRE